MGEKDSKLSQESRTRSTGVQFPIPISLNPCTNWHWEMLPQTHCRISTEKLHRRLQRVLALDLLYDVRAGFEHSPVTLCPYMADLQAASRAGL